MLIYISHIYQNKEENKQEVERIIKSLIANDKKYLPEHKKITYVSPVHCYGFLYEEVEYEEGLKMCIELLKHCDMMLVYGDYQNSVGCKAEIKYCDDNGIPYEIIKGE